MEGVPTSNNESIKLFTEEIRAITTRIEDMVGNMDIEPSHLEEALAEARAVYEKYENVEGDEDFDAALDTLLGTIDNTEALEGDIQQKSAERMAGMEAELDEAA